MEYRITTSEIPAQRLRKVEDYTGLLMHIRPPIPHLNPEAVERYLLSGALEPLVPGYTARDTDNDLDDVNVLASTPEQTTIYASVVTDAKAAIIEEVTTNLAKFLAFMGATAIVEGQLQRTTVSLNSAGEHLIQVEKQAQLLP